MAISFSQKTKNDVLRIVEKYKCCSLSLLYGILYGGNDFSKEKIRLVIENIDMRRVFEKLFKQHFDEEIIATDGKYLICNSETLRRIFALLEIGENDDPGLINCKLFKCQFCSWAFIRGVFLSCGTVTTPKSEYHLEMLFKDAERAAQIANLLSEKGCPPKITVRGSTCGVYYKESEKIEDFLFSIGAKKASFDFMNEKILKGVANDINRTNNFLAANMMKSISAGQKQLNAIYKIINKDAISMLPDELRETFDLRAANPDTPLSALAEMHNPPLTKSGVNHRLGRIVEFADKLGK